MTLQNPTYIQDICYTARDDRLQMAGMLAAEGVATFSQFRVTQQAVASKFIDISLGHAYINNDQDTAAGEGGYYHAYNNNTVSVPITDNISGSTRLDYVWLKITDTAYVAGTSGASFVVNQTASPSDGSTYFPLATISVPSGFASIQGYPPSFGATDAQITDTRTSFITSGTSSLRSIITYTAVGAGNTFTPTDYPGLKGVRVRLVGGGGGGGGTPSTSGTGSAMGIGGGAGGYAESFIPISSLTSPITVTVGAGGTAGANADGGSGGTSSFGSLVIATGGAGGAKGTADTAVVSINPSGTGSGTVGSILQRGGVGSATLRLDSAHPISGSGGDSVFQGAGATRSANGTSAGPGLAAQANSGSGGSGAVSSNTAATQAGGVGGAGIVIVEIY